MQNFTLFYYILLSKYLHRITKDYYQNTFIGLHMLAQNFKLSPEILDLMARLPISLPL